MIMVIIFVSNFEVTITTAL